MSLRETIFKSVGPLFVEIPVRRKSIQQLQHDLRQTKALIESRAEAAAGRDLEKSRATLRHIIGIERWGIERLKVALGEPFKRDGQKDYHPDSSLGLTQLREVFSQTRLETLQVAQQLENRQPEHTDSSFKIEHNALGPISVKAWLGYLNLHGEMESRRLR
jgi:hypothetical protein